MINLERTLGCSHRTVTSYGKKASSLLNNKIYQIILSDLQIVSGETFTDRFEEWNELIVV